MALSMMLPSPDSAIRHQKGEEPAQVELAAISTRVAFPR